MSRTRIFFLVALAALLLAYAAYSSPGSYLWLMMTGRCRVDPIPAACHWDKIKHHGFAILTRRQ